ncbi:MAG TPA: amino acid adenylation domain-containing protein, partial [Longimicrobiaceae bacterium]
LTEVSLLRDGERALLREWNATERDSRGRFAHDRFAEQASRTPASPAVVEGGETLTYAGLDRRSGRLARLLRERGVGPGARVGVCLERSADLVVAELAVLRAGAAYLPLDPGYPRERLAFMLRDSGAALALTREALRAGLPGDVEALCVDTLGEEPDGEEPAPRVALAPESLAYVIYTSGSTGTPKGVMVSHGALAHMVSWYARAFALAPSDRTTMLASPGFDAAVGEIWPGLARGAALYPVSGESRLAPAALQAFLLEEGIDLCFVPTPLAEGLLAREWPAETRLRVMVTAGDALRVRPRAGLPFALVNSYGPTENTMVATSGGVSSGGAGAPTIGAPIDRVRAYVLDPWLGLLPAGVPGELYVGGAGVARGYLGRPELTAERFVPDAFGGAPGARAYRTGDRVRWTATGELEFLGRIDAQVKIRGFRVEPGEVEAALLAHPGVREAAVVAREDAPGEKRLVAYVVAEAGAAELRAWLRERVPEYMVPSAVVHLEAMPLTPNRKLDRRALPAPGAAADGEYVAPRTAAEEILCGIWAEVLGAGRVGAAGNFFELGGHSLLAMQVVSRVRRTLGVELPLRALFEAPTVAELAGRVEALRQVGAADAAPPLVPGPRDRPLPLSFAQQRLWLVDRMEPGSPAYNLPFTLRLRGALDEAALGRSLDALVRRHESLRTGFAEVDGEPVQVIRPAGDAVLATVDLRGLPCPEREAVRLAGEEAASPFDLSRGPLLRARLLRLRDEDHVLCFTLHHVVSDGWSMDVLVRDVSALYGGRGDSLPELPVQYADYAVWQRRWLEGGVLEAQLGWWKARLAGAPPLLEIPTDRPRGAAKDARAGRLAFALPAELSRELRALSRREGATLFMTLLAGWQVLLGRYAGQDDVVVGSPVAGRTREELEGLIGFFVNMLPLRGELGGGPTWRELLGRVREGALGAYAHQDLPFERLVEELATERSLTHTPLFQVVFALQRAGSPDERLSLGPVALEPFAAESTVAKFELDLAVLEEDGEEALTGVVVYRDALFGAETVERMVRHLEVVLEAMVADPARRVSDVSLLVGAERVQVLEAWNATAADFPRGCVHELFAAQAARTPDAPAVVSHDGTLTYAELERRANGLAHVLRTLGAGADARVALLLRRGVDAVVGVLAVLKAGAAYVPLDPGHPDERLRFMLQDVGAAAVVTDSTLAGRIAGFAGAVVRMGADARTIAGGPELAPASGAGPHTLACVIYTSGSTGAPKGVLIEHRGLSNYLAWFDREVLGAGGFAIPLVSRLSFDAHVRQLFPPLLRGEPVRVLPEETVTDPRALLEAISGYEHASFGGVPSLWSAMLELVRAGEAPKPAGLRAVLLGGEALPAELAGRTFALFPGVALWNHYGPTEATVNTTVARLRAGERIRIGRPIANARVYLLDGEGNPVPVGVPGELYVGGAGVSRGYLGRPELTAERYLPDPFRGEAGARMYRSGDRVRWSAEGELEYVGRVDRQVKVRGFRIEPGEVEAVLERHPAVREAVVALREEAPGSPRLVGYVVAGAGAPPTSGELRSYLEERLPEHMVPGAFVVLEALPLTPNGKVDLRALPAPEVAGAGDERRYLPGTPTEELLCGIWAEVLGVERVGVEEDFFELGGHSLLATQVVSRARRALGVELPLRAIFEAPVPAGLAERIDALRAAGAGAPPPMERVGREDPLPLSFAQQRLWVVDRLEPGSPAYNMPFALRLRGALDTAALRASLDGVVRRHEALRTVFAEQGGAPVQVIHPPAPAAMT